MAYEQEIAAAATRYGIDPEVPLAVAKRESGRQQFRSDGSVVTGRAGEIGIFQIMPSTAPGVNLADPLANIDFGCRYLASLLSKFGSWPLALAAYNWGEGHVRDAIARAKAIPASVAQYVDAILGPQWASSEAKGLGAAKAGLSTSVLALGVLGAAAILILVTE
jgi:soluble lytic murein transglycosylase-like protein